MTKLGHNIWQALVIIDGKHCSSYTMRLDMYNIEAKLFYKMV